MLRLTSEPCKNPLINEHGADLHGADRTDSPHKSWMCLRTPSPLASPRLWFAAENPRYGWFPSIQAPEVLEKAEHGEQGDGGVGVGEGGEESKVR